MVNIRIGERITATYITEGLVHFKDFVGDLGAGHHGPLPHFLQDGLAEEHELLILLVLTVVFILVSTQLQLLGRPG